MSHIFESLNKNDYKEIFVTHDSIPRDSNEKLRIKKIEKILWNNKLNIEDYNDVGYTYKDGNITINLYDNDENIILTLELTMFFDGYGVNYVNVSDLGAGKKLSLRTYLRFVDFFNIPLYSDNMQTDISKRGIWYKLYELYPERVSVFFKQKEYPIINDNGKMKFIDDNGNKISVYGTDEIHNFILLKLSPI